MSRRLIEHLGQRFCVLGALVALTCGTAGAEAAQTDAALPDGAPAAQAQVSFRNDVMAVFAKAGCSAGACHGNRSGKGGFKLSLRGQEPDVDFLTLTRDQFGRRVNPVEPAQSLIVQKATAAVPHEGGRRFSRDSDEYRILLSWLQAGAPRDGDATPKLDRLDVTPAEQVLVAPAAETRITATAHFSDGTARDVSRLAVYEQSADLARIAPDGLVTRGTDGETAVIVTYLNRQQVVRLTFVPERPGFVPVDVSPNNVVDEHVFAKLRALRINPSDDCGDLVYLRRAYLDLLGVLPTAAEAQAFAADAAPDKRAKLVDALLARPEYAEHWALKWADLLRVEERTLDATGVAAMHNWLKASIAANEPLDQFAARLVAGTGSTYANPPANYYRALRDPVTRGEATAQVFLGTRLGCAQCHNHPFDRWTQDDYYGWADVFSRVDYKIVENKRKDENDSHEFVGEQIVELKPSGSMKDPRTDKDVAAARFLGTPDALPAEGDRLAALAAWMTSSDLFARAQVNRIWASLMGRGIVDPIDDFRATNPPSHPALLDRLTADFIAAKYDVRSLIRQIMASKAYARSAVPNDTNAADETNYSRALPRRLTAEQLLDAQHEALGVQPEFAGYGKGLRAGQIPGVRVRGDRKQRPTPADQFLAAFGKPPRQISCDCERSNETTLNQAFQLIGGPTVASLLAEPDNRIAKLIAAGKTEKQIVQELYWSTLTRPPGAEELAGMTTHVTRSPDRRKALEDVAWALLNSKEFVLRQ